MTATPRYSAAYLDGLFSSDAYQDIVQIWSLLCATERFSLTEIEYGLPQPLFVFGETLVWSAQSCRSGAITYYEAAPPNRQEALRRGLEAIAALPLARCYAQGMRNWRNRKPMQPVDDWIKEHDRETVRWLRSLVLVNRSTVEELLR